MLVTQELPSISRKSLRRWGNLQVLIDVFEKNQLD